MAEKNGIYKCEICGNVVEVLESGQGALVCCGMEMKLFEAKAEEEGMEKHVPVLSIEGDKAVVKVGSVDHPMDEIHFIELIQLFDGAKLVGEKRLFPNEKPLAEFKVNISNDLKARAFCNVHGLWTS